MANNDSGKFRGSWMFNTHHTVYHLDQANNIVGVHCDKIRDEIIGIQTGITVAGYIGNPGVFVLGEAKDDGEISQICAELTTTYSGRITRWLDHQATTQVAA